MASDEKTEVLAEGDAAKQMAATLLGAEFARDVIRIERELAPPNQTGSIHVGDATVFVFADREDIAMKDVKIRGQGFTQQFVVTSSDDPFTDKV